MLFYLFLIICLILTTNCTLLNNDVIYEDAEFDLDMRTSLNCMAHVTALKEIKLNENIPADSIEIKHMLKDYTICNREIETHQSSYISENILGIDVFMKGDMITGEFPEVCSVYYGGEIEIVFSKDITYEQLNQRYKLNGLYLHVFNTGSYSPSLCTWKISGSTKIHGKITTILLCLLVILILK